MCTVGLTILENWSMNVWTIQSTLAQVHVCVGPLGMQLKKQGVGPTSSRGETARKPSDNELPFGMSDWNREFMK